MFDTLLIITLFLPASLLVCLLTLRLSINIKHLCLFFHPTLPPFNLTSPPPLPPLIAFIRHIRVALVILYEIDSIACGTLFLKVLFLQKFAGNEYCSKLEEEFSFLVTYTSNIS